MKRRDLLKLGLGTAAYLAASNPILAAAKAAEKAGKKIPLALQLYSLRDDKRPFPELLEAVAGIGYEGVEFAGFQGLSGKQLKKILDDVGMKCAGSHSGLPLDDASFQKTVELHQTLGTPNIMVPGMPHEMKDSVDAVKKTAEKFNKVSEKLDKYGLRIGYHAHGSDFKKLENGRSSWELFFELTRPEVAHQMDVGNCRGAHANPYAIIPMFPGRTKTIHVKEESPDLTAAVGDGQVDWHQIFEICETVGGTEWYIVEQEKYNVPPFESVTRSINNLRAMGK